MLQRLRGARGPGSGTQVVGPHAATGAALPGHPSMPAWPRAGADAMAAMQCRSAERSPLQHIPSQHPPDGWAAHLRSPPDTPRTKALPTNVSAALPRASSLITSSTSWGPGAGSGGSGSGSRRGGGGAAGHSVRSQLTPHALAGLPARPAQPSLPGAASPSAALHPKTPLPAPPACLHARLAADGGGQADVGGEAEGLPHRQVAKQHVVLPWPRASRGAGLTQTAGLEPTAWPAAHLPSATCRWHAATASKRVGE